MKIKTVEELVGITKKNIRFYEEQGLLAPGRAENGYREYSEADMRRLKQIKFLRKLYVPVEEIRELFEGKISLDGCLEKHLEGLDRRRLDLEEIKRITEGLLAENSPQHPLTIDSLDIDSRLENIARLEHEGRRFMNIDVNDVHRKKTFGAVTGAVIFIALMIVVIALVLWGNSQDPLPDIILVTILGFPAVAIVCVIMALSQRVKEIKGGEEDEAAKY